ncbi:MAG: dihydrofolate reductase, partial [Verrucomicrobia bacterium]|nr:dihydrofolate reductase [Verrucomicrobiota bacterium]
MTSLALAATVVLYIATSQDGFIADANGNLDWLPQTVEQTAGQDYGYKEFYDSVETLAIGRATYEQILGFGP